MDRNYCTIVAFQDPPGVALRKESVDRNLAWHCISEDVSVALRKESVDRNRVCTTIITICTASLSARRAWIEILFGGVELG